VIFILQNLLETKFQINFSENYKEEFFVHIPRSWTTVRNTS